MSNMYLKRKFDEYNKEFFGQSILPIDKIYSTSRFSKALARATLVSAEGRNRQTIAISAAVVNDERKLKEVMLHEMIHVKRFQDYLRTGDSAYLDEIDDGSNPNFSRGHGKWFYDAVSQIVARDPTVVIRAEDDNFFSQNIRRGNFYYFDVLYMRDDGVRRSIFYTDRSTYGKKIDDLKESFEHLYGKQSLISIEFKKTKDPAITNYSRLTSKFDLRKNQVPVHYSDMDLAMIANIKSDLIERREFDIDERDFNKSLGSTLVKLRRIKYLSFSDYMLGVVANDNGLKPFLGVNDVTTYINLIENRESDLKTIFYEWKNIRPDEIKRTQLYYEVLSSEGLGSRFEEAAIKALVNFGVNRIKHSDYLSYLRSDTEDRYPYTLLNESFDRLSELLKNCMEQRVFSSYARFIGMDKQSYMVGCVLSRMNDGYRVSKKELIEIENGWLNPTASHVAGSLHLSKNMEQVFSEMLQLYQNKQISQASRISDGMVSGWSTFIERGVSPKSIAFELVKQVESIISRNRNVGRKNLVQDAVFVNFLTASLDASISHCYGGAEMRKRKKNTDLQMDIFG